MRCFPLVAGLLLALPARAEPQQRGALRAGWELAPEAEPGRVPEAGWQPARVPATFEDLLGADFDGVCWYRLRLARPDAAEGARFRVRFAGAATAAEAWADGVSVGAHLGAWTPWSVDLTAALADGEAELLVRVDERPGHNTQGFLPVIQPHFGGLWRSVELLVETGPVLDEDEVFVFGELGEDGTGWLRYELPVAGGELRAELLDGAEPVPTRPRQSGLEVQAPRAWSPDDPFLYTARFALLGADGEVLDTLERRVGFRRLSTDGTTVLWNGRPLQLRGVLHWGYSAPSFAPPEDAEHWRPQLEAIRAMGCNLVKACLWMPPRSFYDLADELGLIVWQEYPTWHPTLTERYLPELRREYEEFHRFDRSHPSVAIRSLTCETGHSAELEVIRALYDRCKQLVPQTLVVDDSAWIEWHRVHDFYDDHPYGNNSWWPGKLRQLREHVAAREPMPLLLGECIASDTWMDLGAWEATGLPDDAWWAPWGLPAQRGFEALVERRFGAETRASLRPVSLRYARENRKYQVERLRQSLPDAGYVLSVVRDITKCRMGLFDDFGAFKGRSEDWDWHRDTLLALDTEGDRRAFAPGPAALPVRVSHFGSGRLEGRLTLAVEGLAERAFAVALAPGGLSEPFALELGLPEVARPRALRLTARLEGSHAAVNDWELWLHPAPAAEAPPGVRVVERLDADTLAALRSGGRVLLRAGDRKGSLKTSAIWFLKGAPWAPPHPLNAELPAELLLGLQGFDLEAGRVLHGEAWIEHVDPLLGFWDTHDTREVNPWLLAWTASVGSGRLGVSVLDHDTGAGRWVEQRMLGFLAEGPAPRSALPAELVSALEQALEAEVIELVDWTLAVDRDDRGRGAGWMDGGAHEAAEWLPIRAGAHWEAQGFEHLDGVAWYRTALEVPRDWAGKRVTAVFEGVDDSYQLYLDGQLLGSHGDPGTGRTVWLERTTVELTPRLRPGERQQLVLRVVDHQGAGGLHRPAFVTTGPVDPAGDLVH